MREWIKELSDTKEIILVLFIGFGYFIFNSTGHFFQISTSDFKQWKYSIDNSSGIVILIYEFIAGTIIILILRERGWTLGDFNLKVKVKSFLHGLLLVILALFILGLINFILVKTGLFNQSTETGKLIKFENERHLIVWGLLIIFNSIFEESLYIGFLHKRLGDNKAVFIGVSTTLRVVIHLYQGLLQSIPMIITGLVYGTYYSKYRQLTPIIIAHGLWNLFYVLRTA